MKFEFQSRLSVPRDALFEFHTNPEKLGVLLSGWKWTKVVATEGHIRPGARVGILESLGPIKLRFEFEHYLLEPPHRFAERMVKGLFKQFDHLHEFEEVDGEPGVTVIHDRISVQLPWWLGGALATRLIVARRLRKFFGYRHVAYERLAAEGKFPTPSASQ